MNLDTDLPATATVTPTLNLRSHALAIEDLAPRLWGQGYWLRGGEWNTLPPQEFDKRTLKVLIARLSTYADTAESFTHTLLYQALASVPDVYPDMAYLPPPRDGGLLTEAGIPWLVGTQSKCGPEAFQVIALSNAIVQELVNLPTILQRSGLWVPRSERLLRNDIPIMLLGGANAFHASLIDHVDSPLDGLFVGESLEDIQALFSLCAKGRREGWSKVDLLEKLESIPGFAQPGSPKPTRKRNVETLDIRRLSASRPVLYKSEGLGQEPVALSRGCPAFCSFCAESFDLKPYRENPQDAVVESALKLKREMGLEAIDLFSFNFNFYEDLYPLLERLGGLFSGIGLKSQRFDMIAHDPGLLGYLRALGKASLTFGMEGISARLRRYLQKGLEEGDLTKALQSVFRHQMRELKVFMIATGLEDEEDYAEFAEFLKHLPELMRVCDHPPKIMFSATPLVRFPWTPLEFAPAPPPERYRAIAKRLGRIVENAGFQWREAAEEPENYVSQILVRADRPAYWEALQAAVAETGFIYFREVDHRFMAVLRRQLAERGLTDDVTLAGGDLASHASKPWARHDTGVRRNFLWVQYKRAARHEDKGYCLGTTEKEGTCLACDSCETEEDTESLIHVRKTHESDASAFLASLKAYRLNAMPVPLAMEWTPRVIGLPRKYVGLVVASVLMRTEPTLTNGFWRYKSCWSPAEGQQCHVAGEDILALEWQGDTARKLIDLLDDPIFLNEVNARMAGWGRVKGLFQGKANGEASRSNEGNLSVTETLLPQTWIFQSPYAMHLLAYAQPKGLPFTQCRRGTGWEAVFSKDALKKKFLKSITWEQMPEGDWCIEVKPLAKFQPDAFLREAFKLPEPHAWARIRTRAEGLHSVVV
jgi:radical SAM superfamily enzyme YgiQ (UPF0313 family)